MHKTAGCTLRRDFPELFAVPENKIHVLIKSHELADKHPAILDRNSHPVIDKLQHFSAAARLRHLLQAPKSSREAIPRCKNLNAIQENRAHK